MDNSEFALITTKTVACCDNHGYDNRNNLTFQLMPVKHSKFKAISLFRVHIPAWIYAPARMMNTTKTQSNVTVMGYFNVTFKSRPCPLSVKKWQHTNGKHMLEVKQYLHVCALVRLFFNCKNLPVFNQFMPWSQKGVPANSPIFSTNSVHRFISYTECTQRNPSITAIWQPKDCVHSGTWHRRAGLNTKYNNAIFVKPVRA